MSHLLSQTVFFLYEDEKWVNLRTHWMHPDVYGEQLTTFIFGVIISIVCPLFFILQNLCFGCVLNYYSIWKGHAVKVLCHIFKTMTQQTIVLVDTALFRYDGRKEMRPVPSVMILATSYLAYLLPQLALLTTYIFASSSATICTPLASQFLLDNTIAPANNLSLSKLYDQRQSYGRLNGKRIEWNDTWENRGLLWNSRTLKDCDIYCKKAIHKVKCRKKEEYWKLRNSQDLIDQFNYLGFHDVCNFPTKHDLQHIHCPMDSKGFPYLFPGYGFENSTGPEFT